MKFLCKPSFKQFPWEEYPVFLHQLKQYGLTENQAYLLCETGTENLYYENKERGWNNLLIETRLAPRKTLFNKIGEFASQGTSCVCCLGWRIWTALVAGFVVGGISGVLL